jgi:hypothetical protein
MSQYGTIDVAVWNDGKFRELSAPPPCGQVLWLYLLAPRERKLIPGLIPAGVGTLSESLRWPYEATRAALNEVLAKAMAEEDAAGPLIWLPNALKHNPPDNPNQVKGWGKAWKEIPECPLKRRAWEHLRTEIEPRGEGFQEAFRKAFPEPLQVTLPLTVPETVPGKVRGKVAGKVRRNGSAKGSPEGLGEHQHQHQHQQEAAAAAREGASMPQPSLDPAAVEPASTPFAAEAASGPIPSAGPGTPGPGTESADAREASHATGPEKPATEQKPVGARPPRAARPADDDPPPRLLLVHDVAELGPLGAEFKGLVEVGLKRPLLSSATDKRAEVRDELEQLLERHRDVERCANWVIATITGREGSGGPRVQAITPCVAMLRSLPAAVDRFAAARAACPAYAQMLEEIERMPLESRLPPEEVERWLATLRPTLRAGELVLEAEDAYHRDLVEQLYLKGLRRLATEVVAPHVVVTLSLAAAAAKEA